VLSSDGELWRDHGGLALNPPGMAAAGRRPRPGISRSAVGERLQGMGIKQPFEKVVEGHGATVLRVCRVLLAGPDADDAWSETFLAALRAYPGLPETANVEAWLVTIAHRKAIDVLRARRRHPVPVGELPEGPAGAGVPGTGDSGLWEAVRELPDKQRQAVAYHYVAGLPYAEIAGILGGTTEAARRAAADGIRNLRKNYPGGAPS
jgi:DNA-directed RNA polymerase specialized sigma24 family protein